MIKKTALFIFLLSPQLITCMDNLWYGATIQNILIEHIHCNPGTFSHDTICALALVNKTFNKAILDSAKKRRLYLALQKDYQEIHRITPALYQQQVWHKNNSAYAYWMTNPANELFLNLECLDGNNNLSKHQLQRPNDKDYIYGPELTKIQIFFNTQGNACYYEWRRLHSTMYAYYPLKLIEHSLNTRGSQKTKLCYISLNNTPPQNNHTQKKNYYFIWVKSTTPEVEEPPQPNNLFNFHILEEYPLLLNAFVHSQCVKETNEAKIYDVTGVTLDQDYLLNGYFPNKWWKDTIAAQCIVKK